MKSNFFNDRDLSRKICSLIVIEKIHNKEKFTKDDYITIDILLRDYIKRIDENVHKR